MSNLTSSFPPPPPSLPSPSIPGTHTHTPAMTGMKKIRHRQKDHHRIRIINRASFLLPFVLLPYSYVYSTTEMFFLLFYARIGERRARASCRESADAHI